MLNARIEGVAIDGAGSHAVAVSVDGVVRQAEEACYHRCIVNADAGKCKHSQLGGQMPFAGCLDSFVGMQEAVHLLDKIGVEVEYRAVECLVERFRMIVQQRLFLKHGVDLGCLPRLELTAYCRQSAVEFFKRIGMKSEEFHR